MNNILVELRQSEWDTYRPIHYFYGDQLFILKPKKSKEEGAEHRNAVITERIHTAFQKAIQAESEKQESIPKYQSLYLVMKNLILHHRIPDGYNLPPGRLLAKNLGIARSTLNKALELASMEGLIESRQGSGAYVRLRHREGPRISRESLGENFPELSQTGKAFSGSVSLINSTEDKSIGFRPGIPPLDLFPVNQWKNLSNQYWRHVRTSEMIYSPSAGLVNVKKSMASYLNISRNLRCDADHVMIVAGSLQSLYLVGNVLIDPGDGVLLENPVFPNVRAIFRGLRANCLFSEIDNEGIQIPESLPKDFNLKLIHCTPSCQYPLGTRMSLKRRMELLEFARKHKALIIENDYEHEINNFEDSLPSLYELDGGERVIYLGTFNRLLHPSIRIGYMVVPEYLISATESLLKHSHRFVPPSLQVVMSQFIDKKFIYKHSKRVAHAADERRALFIKILQEELSGYLEIAPSEVKSLHLVTRLKKHPSDLKLAQYLGEHHIIAHALSRCYQAEQAEQGLIFGYASVRNPVIRNRLLSMARLMGEFR